MSVPGRTDAIHTACEVGSACERGAQSSTRFVDETVNIAVNQKLFDSGTGMTASDGGAGYYRCGMSPSLLRSEWG